MKKIKVKGTAPPLDICSNDEKPKRRLA